jgi:serine/threonine protein kinase
MLEAVIGKGAYGTVFKATSNASGETVAIKYISLKKASDSLMRVVCREVKINSFLSENKNNIFTPELYDLFFTKETDINDPSTIRGIYIVSEYYR